MPLSRLENFLKNAEGNILYVNPSDFDATDGFENQGNSLTRPFKTIQRALIEAARFSYQNGRNNDKIDRTTILVYPGIHYVDNRPGYSIENVSGNAIYKQRTGASTWTETFLNEFGRNTNYDILDPNNDLYKFNSVNGGVILPRGTSIIGLDLRKTKVRPLYVPDPYDTTVENSSIFNVTGTCYFCQFTFFDADITKTVYKNYTSNRYVPSFSHHKLVSFAYGDGVNKVALGNHQTDLTDLDMYYFKVAKAYGDLTGRSISDFPANTDFEPNIDEFRIVGTLQPNPLGISSITYGDGVNLPTNVITVTTSDLKTGEEKPHDLFVDSPLYIDGVEKDPSVYNGSFTVKEVVGLTTFRYIANSSPTEVLSSDDYSTATVTSESDTVSSASPYVFNCSIRSVYGLCGMLADGKKSDGFKSMVVAQFTGVSLQKDDNAFMVYENGNYKDNSTLSANSIERPLHSNPKSKYKPDYESFHIKVSNNGFIQCVSIFAIGFGKHFVTESGGDMSITNSNSNFGSVSLESSGFKDESFDRDDVGYITHIIPPKELIDAKNNVSWLSLDTKKIVSAGKTSRLYLKGYDDKGVPPAEQVDGYRIGAKSGEILSFSFSTNNIQVDYSTPVLMTVPSGAEISSKKEYDVTNLGSVNSIDANGIFSLEQNHQLYTGETIRIFSDDGIPPDNLECDKIYYAITSSVNNALTANQIQLSYSYNDAINGIEIIDIGNNGGKLKIVSTVSDKFPGELGHPIQYDEDQSNWYITGAASSTTNKIYSGIVGIGTSVIGEETPPTFVTRKIDNRPISDRIYKIRYVIPKEFVFARPPQPGFVIQESKTVSPSNISFNDNQSITVNTPPEYLRNEKIIVNASSGSVLSGKQEVTITTEKPHNFIVGDKVKVRKIKSSGNPTGLGITSTYNGSYVITSVPNSRQFKYEISGVKVNPGTFTNLINERDTRIERDNLPLVSREEMKNTLYIYRVNTIRKHIPGATGQDGVYHIIALSSNISAPDTINYNLNYKKFNQDVRNLYPQIDRDNVNYDPASTISSAYVPIIGKVVTNDKKKSITKESVDALLKNTRIGIAITGITAVGSGNTNITISSEIEHGLNSILDVSVTNAGSGYGNTTIYSSALTGGTGSGAIAKISLTSGTVSSIKIIDGGSGYSVGDQLTVSAPSGITPSQNSTLNVTQLNNNVNDGLQLCGFENQIYNNVFRIKNIISPKSIELYGPVSSSVPSIDLTSKIRPYFIHSSPNIGITSIKFENVSTGIVTVTTNISHGLVAGNKFTIVGSGHTIYDSSFIVRNTPSLNSFDFYVGITTQSKASDVGFVYKNSLSSNGSSLGQAEDNLSSRVSYIYAGISTTLSSSITPSSSSIQLTSSNGFNRGDYILINNEILRISSSASGNTFNVLRGQLGTYGSSAVSNTLIKKIKVLPTELRRPSFMRASGHTFEYLGYGPGNYSTGMPQKQSVVLSEDEVMTSQARKMSGGVVVYSAMNDLGEFYSGSKKLSATTGEETVIEAPIITYTGDDAKSDQQKRVTGFFDEILVRERLTVEGGENNNQSSQFYGPVNFTQKVTSTSDSGIVAKNISLKGNLSKQKLITVGIGTTSNAIDNEITTSNTGDIVLLSDPDKFIGFVKGKDYWKKFGLVSQKKDKLVMLVDSLGISTNTVGEYAAENLYVAGKAVFEQTLFTGETIFDSAVTLNDVRFQDLLIKGTAVFNPDFDDDPNNNPSWPGAGTTTITQRHTYGVSILNDLEVSGISSFTKSVAFKSNVIGIGATFGKIQIGITTNNQIDTSDGGLIIGSNSGITTVNDNLNIMDGDLSIIKSTSGIVTTRIKDSNRLQIGISTSGNITSRMELYDRGVVGLELKRSNVGTGDSSSSINHYGNSDFIINAVNASRLRLATNNTDRLVIDANGFTTSYYNNTGSELKGAHFSLVQTGTGDVVYSWISNNNNNIQRWYAGIDTSDNYSWKLAYPKSTVAFGLESFDTVNETKLSVDRNGNVSITGNININGDQTGNTASIISNKSNFNLLTTNVTNIGFAHSATTVAIGSDSSNSSVSIRGTTESTSSSSGALIVSGGVGIGKDLQVGGDVIISGTDLKSTTNNFNLLNDNVTSATILNASESINIGAPNNTSVTNFKSTKDSDHYTNGSVLFDGGVGVKKKLRVGELVSVGGASTIEFASEASMVIIDNKGSSFVIKEANNPYITIDTTNSSEKITLNKIVNIDSGIIPTSNSGAYLGSSGKSFSSLYVDNIYGSGNLTFGNLIRSNQNQSRGILGAINVVDNNANLTRNWRFVGAVNYTAPTTYDPYLELATSNNDNSNTITPIYVRSYKSGENPNNPNTPWNSILKEITLMDSSGNTKLAGDLILKESKVNQTTYSLSLSGGSSGALENNFTITLPTRTGYIALTSSSNGDIDVGAGIDISSNKVVIKNNASLTANTISKWTSDNQFANSSISDNGTTVSTTLDFSAKSLTSSEDLTFADLYRRNTSDVMRGIYGKINVDPAPESVIAYTKNWRFVGGVDYQSNSGPAGPLRNWYPYLEIATTGRDGDQSGSNTPIYVRSYSGGSQTPWNSISKEMILMDSDGSTTLAGDLKFKSTSNNITISAPSGASASTIILPKVSDNTKKLAVTSQVDGTIILGTDTTGQYASTIIGGFGLSATTANADDATAYTIDVNVGAGIGIIDDKVVIKNNAALTANTISKWDNTNKQFTDSSISDNGTAVSTTLDFSAKSLTSSGDLTFGDVNRGTTNNIKKGIIGSVNVPTYTGGDSVNYIKNWRLIGATDYKAPSGLIQESWNSYVELSVTGRDGNQANIPIIVRSYSGNNSISWLSIAKEMILLDSDGSTTLAGDLKFKSTSNNITISAPSGASAGTLTLPKATSKVIAVTSQVDGTIVLGTDTTGQYASTIIGGFGLSATTANADDATAYTIDVNVGAGISIADDKVILKNSSALTANTISKWDNTNKQFTDSSISDDGTEVTITKITNFRNSIKFSPISSNGIITISSPSTNDSRTLTLPNAVDNTKKLAVTSQVDGSITLGTDTTGQYASTITGGSGLSATTANADDATAYTIDVNIGAGIDIIDDKVILKNSSALTANTISKWDNTNKQFTDSSISETSTAVSTTLGFSADSLTSSNTTQTKDLTTTTTGDAITVQNGGDIKINTSNNTGSVKLYCDTNSNLSINGSVSASSSITATSFSGNGIIPLGGIIMWSGSTVPTGWTLCNGNNGNTINGISIPDLRDKFIVGSGPNHTLKTTGGSNSASLSNTSKISNQYLIGNTINDIIRFYDGAGLALSTVEIKGNGTTLCTLTPYNEGASSDTGLNSVESATPTINTAYTVYYAGSPMTTDRVRIVNGVLRFDDVAGGTDFNDIILEARHGEFYIENDFVYYKVTATDIATQNTISTQPEWYALAFIIRTS